MAVHRSKIHQEANVYKCLQRSMQFESRVVEYVEKVFRRDRHIFLLVSHNIKRIFFIRHAILIIIIAFQYHVLTEHCKRHAFFVKTRKLSHYRFVFSIKFDFKNPYHKKTNFYCQKGHIFLQFL